MTTSCFYFLSTAVPFRTTVSGMSVLAVATGAG
jgi:hypothetical protein